MGMGAIRNGLGKSDFLDNNGLPKFGPEQSAPTEKPGNTGKNNPHAISGSPPPPPPGGGRGRSRTQLPHRESIPGKTTGHPVHPSPANPAKSRLRNLLFRPD